MVVLSLTMSAVAGPTTAPATPPTDAPSAAAFIDDFLAGRDATLIEHASSQLKEALAKTSLADVRDQTVGSTAKRAGGPDKVLVSCTRRVTTADGKTYELIATVTDGQLAGFFVRSVE